MLLRTKTYAIGNRGDMSLHARHAVVARVYGIYIARSANIKTANVLGDGGTADQMVGKQSFSNGKDRQVSSTTCRLGMRLFSNF